MCLQVSWEQQRREKRITKKAEEVENTLREEEYKHQRLVKTQKQLAELSQAQSTDHLGTEL